MPLQYYGANGYTGEMIAREAANRGMKPILAGRSAHKIEPLARELGLRHRAFAVLDADEIAPHLTDVDVVLHCAGPFSATSAPMIEACLRTSTQYLDISGEIEVFETCLRLGFDAPFRLSPGTSKTIVEWLSSSGRARVDGQIIPVTRTVRGPAAAAGGGYYTPTQLLGADIVTTLPGSSSVTVD